MDDSYRLGVGIILQNSEGKVFAGRRIDNSSEAWQLPQGGVDNDEDHLNAAFRELEEETGIKPEFIEFIYSPDKLYYYDLPHNLQNKLWGGKYRGQKQKWYLFKFLSDDSKININTETPEFIEWKWCEFEDLPDMIVDFKKPLYEELAIDFKRYLS